MSDLPAEVIDQLSQLRSALTSARSMPMSASVMVNRDGFMGMIDNLQAVLEQATVAASQIIQEQEQLLRQAQDEVDEMLHSARMEQERLVSDTSVFQMAKAQADELIASAEHEAEALRAETDEYVEKKLADFEASLEKVLQAVRRGRLHFEHGHVGELGQSSDEMLDFEENSYADYAELFGDEEQ